MNTNTDFIIEIGRLAGKPLFKLIFPSEAFIESSKLSEQNDLFKYEMTVSLSDSALEVFEEIAPQIYETLRQDMDVKNGRQYYTSASSSISKRVVYRATDTEEKRADKHRDAKKTFEIEYLKENRDNIFSLRKMLSERLYDLVRHHNLMAMMSFFNEVKGKVTSLEEAFLPCLDGRLVEEDFNLVCEKMSQMRDMIEQNVRDIIHETRSRPWRVSKKY